jgi:hypothetical protein
MEKRKVATRICPRSLTMADIPHLSSMNPRSKSPEEPTKKAIWKEVGKAGLMGAPVNTI